MEVCNQEDCATKPKLLNLNKNSDGKGSSSFYDPCNVLHPVNEPNEMKTKNQLMQKLFQVLNSHKLLATIGNHFFVSYVLVSRLKLKIYS